MRTGHDRAEYARETMSAYDELPAVARRAIAECDFGIEVPRIRNTRRINWDRVAEMIRDVRTQRGANEVNMWLRSLR